MCHPIPLELTDPQLRTHVQAWMEESRKPVPDHLAQQEHLAATRAIKRARLVNAAPRYADVVQMLAARPTSAHLKGA